MNFAGMEHPFARLTVKVQTPLTGSNAIDLTKLTKIVFNDNLHKFEKVTLDASESASTSYWNIHYYSTAAEHTFAPSVGDIKTDASVKYYVLDDIYVQPGTVPVNSELLRLFYVDSALGLNNEYPLKRTGSELKFEKNKKYNITVMLTKTEITEMGVSIKDWTAGEDIDDGNASIDK